MALQYVHDQTLICVHSQQACLGSFWWKSNIFYAVCVTSQKIMFRMWFWLFIVNQSLLFLFFGVDYFFLVCALVSLVNFCFTLTVIQCYCLYSLWLLSFCNFVGPIANGSSNISLKMLNRELEGPLFIKNYLLQEKASEYA